MSLMNKISLSLVIVYSLGASVANAGASQNAKDASGMQKAAQMASQLMGAAMMPACMQTPPNVAVCSMAMAAMAQAASLGGTSQGASDAAVATSAGGGLSASAPAAPTFGGGVGGTAGGVDKNAVRSGLAKLGYSLSEDASQLTTPDGKTVSTASLGSAAGLSAAGFSDSQSKDALAKLAEAQAKVASKFKLGALEGGGEGGGGGGGYSGSGGGSGGASFDMSAFNRRKPASPNLSGMTKNFGGERIGVAGDDIFQMITRQYRSQDNAFGFFRN